MEGTIEKIEHAVFVEALLARQLIRLGGSRDDTGLLYEQEVAEAVAKLLLEWKKKLQQ